MPVDIPRIRTVYSFSVDGATGSLLRWTKQRGRSGHTSVWQGTFPPEGDAEKSLRGALIVAQTEKALICSALPVSDTICRPLETPFASVRKARQVFPSLLNIQLPFELSDCQFTFLNTEANAGRVHTLALAVRNTALESSVAATSAYGLDPHLMFHEGIMIWEKSLREGGAEDAARLRVVVWLGAERTIVLCGHGKKLHNASSFNTAFGALVDNEAERIQWIRRVMLIVKAENGWMDGVDWWWCGPCAGHGETLLLLEKVLGESLSAEFHTHQDSRLFLEQSMVDACFERRTAANLRVGGMAHPSLVKNSQKSRSAAWIALLITGGVICALNVAWLIRMSSLRRYGDTLVAETAREITGGGYIPRGQELFAVEQILNEKGGYLQFFHDLHERQTSFVMQQVIIRASELGIKIDVLDVSRGTIKVEGTVRQWTSAVDLQNQLNRLGFDTRLTREGAGSEEGSRFILRGVIDEPEN